jgi:hypothetical protein
MCNLYTYKMTRGEMRALKLHFQLIGTTWTEWEERQGRRNEPVEEVYPNKPAPVLVLENGEHVVREDMLWGPWTGDQRWRPLAVLDHDHRGQWRGAAYP